MSVHLEAATREIERLNKIARQFEEERDELRKALKVIRIKLGIRDDFVPLGAALELEPIIRSALASTEKETR